MEAAHRTSLAKGEAGTCEGQAPRTSNKTRGCCDRGDVAVDGNLDLTTASGRLMFNIIGAMAEFERALIQERVKAGIRNARAKDGASGGRVEVWT